jgi:hypothetical protein
MPMKEKRVHRRNSLRLLFCALVLLGVGACDGVVVIEGEAKSAADGALADCTALLFRADGHELDRRPIDPDFSATFTVMPGKREYYAEVTCEGYSAYRSEPFTSEGRLGDAPVDLGSFQLRPGSKSTP